jgi:hypothetical protein
MKLMVSTDVSSQAEIWPTQDYLGIIVAHLLGTTAEAKWALYSYVLLQAGSAVK